jgi:Rrf2 family protein
MRLPTRVRYAVRAIVELAERQATGPVSVRALAEAQGISSKYGKQLLNRLQKAGIVKGFPGLRGGYVLARKPEAISVLDVCMAMDGGIVARSVPSGRGSAIRLNTSCDRLQSIS